MAAKGGRNGLLDKVPCNGPPGDRPAGAPPPPPPRPRLSGSPRTAPALGRAVAIPKFRPQCAPPPPPLAAEGDSPPQPWGCGELPLLPPCKWQ